ncbi:MAG: hypothetical protein ACKVTZ_18370 [Bacteroidia bacterium]
MTLFEVLKEVLHDTFFVMEEEREIILTEKSVESKCKQVVLHKGRGKKTLLIPIDDLVIDGQEKDLFPLFRTDKKELRSKCDYCLIYPQKQELFIFLIELKSDNTTGAVKQLKATQLYLKHFIQYIVDLAIQHKLMSHTELENFTSIHYKGIVFSTNPALEPKSVAKKYSFLMDNENFEHIHLRCDAPHWIDAFCS